jgi:hypothetical protein
MKSQSSIALTYSPEIVHMRELIVVAVLVAFHVGLQAEVSEVYKKNGVLSKVVASKVLLRFLSILRLRQTLMTPLCPNPKNAHAIMVTPHME